MFISIYINPFWGDIMSQKYSLEAYKRRISYPFCTLGSDGSTMLIYMTRQLCKYTWLGAEMNWSIYSLCNHVTLYGLASPRLLHSLIDHIKTSHSFKHGYSNGRWVVLYALVSPQWSHAWFRGRVRTLLLPATKLYPCVNKLGGSM